MEQRVDIVIAGAGADIKNVLDGINIRFGLRQDVSALSEDRKTLTFAVLNPSDSEQQLKLTINGAKLGSDGHLWRIAPDKITAVNIVGQKPEVEMQEFSLTSLPDALLLPPFSINLFVSGGVADPWTKNQGRRWDVSMVGGAIRRNDSRENAHFRLT